MKKYFLIAPLLLTALVLGGCTISAPTTDETPGTNTHTDISPANDQEQIEPPASQPIEAPETEVPTQLSQVIDSDPAEVDNSRLPITSVEDLNLTGTPPDVNIEQYRLGIEGLVETPLSLSYEEILGYPTVTEVVLLICPGFFADNAEWTGVPVTNLLEEAGIKPEAETVVFQDIGGSYRIELPLADIRGNDSIFLAHTVDGQTLPADHGYPLRLVAKGKYGAQWVKWVETLEVR